MEKIKLHGFNNLTKTLSFNLYDVSYTKTVCDRKAYIEYIDEEYNAPKLTSILENVTQIIGANILNIAVQDYDPQGASVTILICEESAPPSHHPYTLNPSVVGHLDKSHITVHTYPEYHPDNGVCTFRADIDVSTCGEISPLMALNYLIDSFDADIMTIDYKVRGFTRDIKGNKLFIDHDITSIQNYIEPEWLNVYQMIDVNVYQENTFHTKCKVRNFQLDDYLFNLKEENLNEKDRKKITNRLKNEIDEIFYGRNLPTLY
ncbi:adenosylmethionine decarboxylase [Aminipila luticellarii]|uniref:S-adenosylmethionine decarboxylase proenzyme n=1 Tax=Aminipila luticellarii TaxID=2507160 RepID=A0A410PVI5_9FIRM|nr:adenosylmethionine decarboxylase [Aminipila luticellarii]QAT42959.1 adenosylmethionine decarboxylase [Aminipila luticellarii]